MTVTTFDKEKNELVVTITRRVPMRDIVDTLDMECAHLLPEDTPDTLGELFTEVATQIDLDMDESSWGTIRRTVRNWLELVEPEGEAEVRDPYSFIQHPITIPEEEQE